MATVRTVVGTTSTPFVKFFEGLDQATTKTDPTNLPTSSSNYVHAVAISPNGKYAAALDLNAHGVVVYDMSTNPPTRVANQVDVFPAPATVSGVSFSPDGNTLLVGADIPPFVKSINNAPFTSAPVSAVSHPGVTGNPGIFNPAWSLDGTTVYTYGPTRDEVFKSTFASGTVTYNSVAFTPTGFSGANSGYNLRLSPDGKTMIVYRAGGMVIWTSADGKTGWTQFSTAFAALGNGLVDVQWKPDGTEFIIRHTTAPYIRRYSYPGLVLQTTVQPPAPPNSMCYSINGAELLMVGAVGDGSIQFINLAANTYSTRKVGSISGIAISIAQMTTPVTDDGCLVVCDNSSPFVYFYTQDMVRITSITMTMPTNIGAACAVSWDNKIAIMDYGTRKILVGQYSPDLGTITPITSFDWPGIANAADYASVLRFSPDGTRLMVLAASTAPRFWMYETAGWTLLTGTPSFASMYNADFSPDGQKVAFSTSTSPYVHIYDMATWTLQTGPTTATWPARNIRWSPTGKLLAISVDGGGISAAHRVFRTDTWASITLPSVPNQGPGLYNSAMIDIVEVAPGVEHIAFSSDQANKQLIYSINTSTYTATLQSAPTGGAQTDGLASRGMVYDQQARWMYGLEQSGGGTGRRVTKFGITAGGYNTTVRNPYDISGITQASVQPGGTGGGGFDIATNIGKKIGGGSPIYVPPAPYPQINIMQ